MSWFEHGTSRIYYEDSGSGDPLLLLPGFTDRIEGHTVLRDALQKRYRVIAADLPGSGRSGPQPRTYHAGYLEEDASAFVALLKDRGAIPSHLVGFSDGGEVALLMAALWPEVARSVVTWGAAGIVSDPSGQIRARFRNVVDDPVPMHREYREYLIATYGETLARATTQSFADALGQIIDAGGDISRGRANAITCGVFLIVGEHDAYNPKALIDELASRITRAETIEVEGAGHGVHSDRPEWFTQTVTDWLAKQ